MQACSLASALLTAGPVFPPSLTLSATPGLYAQGFPLPIPQEVCTFQLPDGPVVPSSEDRGSVPLPNREASSCRGA